MGHKRAGRARVRAGGLKALSRNEKAAVGLAPGEGKRIVRLLDLPQVERDFRRIRKSHQKWCLFLGTD